jgi:2-polyprenyl-3-methyl-5-hydroxy-6-metoxy-1,4-benzoquinol methylase
MTLTISTRRRLLVPPPSDLFNSYSDGTNYHASGTYAGYNYFSRWPVSLIKTGHFEAALRLTQDHFGGTAIDFGCADGYFLPSLSQHFRRVYAVDRQAMLVRHAETVAEQLGLRNVCVIDNAALDWPQLGELLDEPGDVAYLLETLEHIGVSSDLYPSKIEFLHGLFTLLRQGGVIAVSVPVMVGLPFLAQRIALRLFRMEREPITFRQLFNAVARRETKTLEASWESWRHLGFNHLELERLMRQEFRILAKQSLGVTQLYTLMRR